MANVYAGEYFEAVLDASGALAKSTDMEVRLRDTETVATLYTDKSKSEEADNPVATSSIGNLHFFAEPGEYDLFYSDNTYPAVVNDHPDEPTGNLAAHEGAADPHPGYATDEDVADVLELQRLPSADFTAGETRPAGASGRVLCIVEDGNVPATDTDASPHPGNPKPGDLVITVPAGA